MSWIKTFQVGSMLTEWSCAVGFDSYLRPSDRLNSCYLSSEFGVYGEPNEDIEVILDSSVTLSWEENLTP
jgi:hypothetical protein